VTYQPTRGSLKDMAQAYWDCFCPRDGDQDNPDKVPDFVEGMIYTKNTGVMMTGNYVDAKEAKAHWRQINEVRVSGFHRLQKEVIVRCMQPPHLLFIRPPVGNL
jgi:hypothetical protein